MLIFPCFYSIYQNETCFKYKSLSPFFSLAFSLFYSIIQGMSVRCPSLISKVGKAFFISLKAFLLSLTFLILFIRDEFFFAFIFSTRNKAFLDLSPWVHLLSLIILSHPIHQGKFFFTFILSGRNEAFLDLSPWVSLLSPKFHSHLNHQGWVLSPTLLTWSEALPFSSYLAH